MSREQTGEAGKCGVETSEGTPCKNPEGSCPWHDAEGAESSSEDSHTIPMSEEFYNTHSGFLGTLMGIEEAWDGKSLATTVASKVAQKYSESTSEKASLYRGMFGECPSDGCQRGCNGFEADYCHTHQDDSPDEDEGSDDSEGVTLDDLTEGQKEKLVGEVLENL